MCECLRVSPIFDSAVANNQKRQRFFESTKFYYHITWACCLKPWRSFVDNIATSSALALTDGCGMARVSKSPLQELQQLDKKLDPVSVQSQDSAL